MELQEHRNEGKHQIVVRMPVSLHARLVDLAASNDLSVNAQVCELVERHVDRVDARAIKAAA